jgi:glyceraldehyde 3-phosphate dehydrogenase
MTSLDKKSSLGINGLGRIGKLTLWHHVARKSFNRLVINVGREVGQSLEDLALYIERDSTYGLLERYLHGFRGGRVFTDLDERRGTLNLDGIPVKFLRATRDPSQLDWKGEGIGLVVDTTGAFVDPTLPEEHPMGCARGHFSAGAKKVIVSAPFKIKDKNKGMPEDAVTTVMGINENDYDPKKHRLISNASCTTTCLAHMIKPLIDHFGADRILTASMATVHAVTGSQEVLDRMPGPGQTDLRKNRGVFNNIILTSTGAARTLALVIPEMEQIGFIAESVRIPTTTGSLVILVVNLQEELEGPRITRKDVNRCYMEAAERDSRGYLKFTETQNVSSDIIGLPRAAAVIEGHETTTRTADLSVNVERFCQLPGMETTKGDLKIAITQAVIYGWYDNELGSYVNMLGDRTVSVYESIK